VATPKDTDATKLGGQMVVQTTGYGRSECPQDPRGARGCRDKNWLVQNDSALRPLRR